MVVDCCETGTERHRVCGLSLHKPQPIGLPSLADRRNRGRRSLNEIISGSVTDAEQIALRERCRVRHVNMTISLAFLAPKLVRAAVEGRLPRCINIKRLRDPPAEWVSAVRNAWTEPSTIARGGLAPVRHKAGRRCLEPSIRRGQQAVISPQTSLGTSP